MLAIAPIDEKVKRLMARMTLDEKIGQLNQLNGFWDVTGPVTLDHFDSDKFELIRQGKVGSMLNVIGALETEKMQRIAVEDSRLGIPLMFGLDVIHGYKTLTPIPIAEAASWDLEMIQKSASMAAREVSAAGIHWTFAPMVDISRDPRWGRVMEGGGEDPFLGSRIAEARVRGFQGGDLSSPHTIAACAKHFAAYGFAEAGRDYNSVDIGTVTLHNVVLPPFKAAADAGVRTFMNAFNILNHIPASGDPYLQRKILKGEWGFNGFIVSDWASIGEMIIHGFAKDEAQAAQIAIEAGSDMDMESQVYLLQLKDLVESGNVDMSYIDDAVKRILTVKYELGLFDDPYRYSNAEREKTIVYAQENRDFALEMAKRSIVLLKNEGKILPLVPSRQRIAVIGPIADENNSPLGSWRIASDDHTSVTLMEGLSQYDDIEWMHEVGVELITENRPWTYELEINHSDRSGFPKAIKAAKEADLVIMAIGEHGFHSAEGRSRANPVIPGLQQELLEAIYHVNPNMVLVLFSGRPLIIPWAAEHIPAIVQVWQLGTESGNAIAQVLMGDYNPSGKLPMTFPRSVGQIPIYYNHMSTGRPMPDPRGADIVFWSHYMDESNEPLFPFGHGLSYSNFRYSNLVVKLMPGHRIEISVTVTNQSQYDGEEVIQLYIWDQFASIVRPIKELKGFEKILIRSNQQRTVSFLLTEKELGFYDQSGTFVFEPGTFTIMVGGSSSHSLEKELEIP